MMTKNQFNVEVELVKRRTHSIPTHTYEFKGAEGVHYDASVTQYTNDGDYDEHMVHIHAWTLREDIEAYHINSVIEIDCEHLGYELLFKTVKCVQGGLWKPNMFEVEEVEQLVYGMVLEDEERALNKKYVAINNKAPWPRIGVN